MNISVKKTNSLGFLKHPKDTKIVDVMIRPSPFKPFYSVTVYENPPGQAASQVVAAAATVAAPGFHGPVQSKQSTSTHSKTRKTTKKMDARL